MRHRRKSRRFGRSSAHRQAMFGNLVTSLFIHERLLTTIDKAKELRRVAERLITLGKRGDLSARRLAARRLRVSGRKEGKVVVHEEAALKKLFETLGPRYESRPGGYTRIVRTGNRLGDNAPMAFVELLPEERKPPGGKKKKATKKGAKKTAKNSSKASAKKSTGKSAAKKPASDEPAKKARKAKKSPAKKSSSGSTRTKKKAEE